MRAAVRAYPARMGKDIAGEEKREQDAVQAAVEAVSRVDGGDSRLKVIRMVDWERSCSLEGAAQLVPCDRATAARWRRQFFERVARNLDLLD